MDRTQKNKPPATHAIIFLYFPDFFSCRCFLQLFIFQLFYIFLWTGTHGMEAQKVSACTQLRCGLQKIRHVWKTCNNFGAWDLPYWKRISQICEWRTRQCWGKTDAKLNFTKFKKSLPQSELRAKNYACFKERPPNQDFLEGKNKAEHVGVARAKRPYPPTQKYSWPKRLSKRTT
jgi:hypothetical protein